MTTGRSGPKRGGLNPWPKRIAAACGAFLCVLGVTVTVGWVTGTPALVQVLPDLPPMTRNAAACFLLCGAALLMLAMRTPRLPVVTCAGIAAAVALITLTESAFGWNAGIDEILGSSYVNVSLRSRGRMAPLTAASFALASIAFVLASPSPSWRSTQLLGINGSLIGAFGVAATIGLGGGVPLAAVPTALGLVVLGFGMLALAWRGDPQHAAAPSWLPVSVAVAVVAGFIGLWRGIVLAGFPPFTFLPAAILGAGCVIAPVFGLTIWLAQRAYAQAADLRRSETFLSEAQHLSRTGSFSWRVSTDIVMYSMQTYRTYGFDSELPVTLDLIATRIHPEDLPLLREMIDRARGPRSDLDYEYRLLMPDRSVKYLHLVAHGSADAQGDVEYIGAIQDVTQRRLSEEALGKVRIELAYVARVASLGALTASIAHEVNQPLTGIITNASTCLRMLAAEPPNLDGARDTAKRMIRDGNRAADVITKLRALFTRRSAIVESIDLNEAAQEVIALSRTEMQRSRVLLRSELAPNLPVVNGDRVQLQQVILNLLLNAADAMSTVQDRSRKLVITTFAETAHRVRLCVEDTGIGFAAEAADQLFDAFYTTKEEGMGIGLSVSRSIIESHQGRLWGEGNVGPGATFSFSLPAGDPVRPASLGERATAVRADTDRAARTGGI